MAVIHTKYDYGQEVDYMGVRGRITGIFIRDEYISYEFSFLDHDGNPAMCKVTEIEIKPYEDNNIGFKKNGEES